MDTSITFAAVCLLKDRYRFCINNTSVTYKPPLDVIHAKHTQKSKDLFLQNLQISITNLESEECKENIILREDTVDEGDGWGTLYGTMLRVYNNKFIVNTPATSTYFDLTNHNKKILVNMFQEFYNELKTKRTMNMIVNSELLKQDIDININNQIVWNPLEMTTTEGDRDKQLDNVISLSQLERVISFYQFMSGKHDRDAPSAIISTTEGNVKKKLKVNHSKEL
jgi:hypothetical protein